MCLTFVHLSKPGLLDIYLVYFHQLPYHFNQTIIIGCNLGISEEYVYPCEAYCVFRIRERSKFCMNFQWAGSAPNGLGFSILDTCVCTRIFLSKIVDS